MEVTAWNNGQHYRSDAGYGFKVSIADRDRHFRRSWSTVQVKLPGQAAPIEVNVGKASFWSDACRELISRELGLWFIEHGYAPWEQGSPPRFKLAVAGERKFRIVDR